jgi:hypothetical protein
VNQASYAASSADGSIEPPPIDSRQALRIQVDLARASQLTMLRFQLALHKSNRRVALQALDDLLDLDAEMEGLAPMPAGAASGLIDDAPLSAFIRHQKSAIAAEKHGLVGGDARSIGSPQTIAPPDAPVEGDGPPEPVAVSEAAEPASLELDMHASMPGAMDTAESTDRASRRPRLYVLAAASIILLAGLALATMLWPERPATLNGIVSQIMAAISPLWG